MYAKRITTKGSMKLTVEQQAKLRSEHDVIANEACDKCGKILGYVRFTIKDKAGEWCSRECRDGIAAAAEHAATRKGARPETPKKQGPRLGRPTLNHRAMTDAERMREYRARKAQSVTKVVLFRPPSVVGAESQNVTK